MKKSSGRKSRAVSIEHWGHRLANVLAEKKISHRASAKLAGVSASVLDSWVKGASPGDLAAVMKLAEALGVSFSWLLVGTYEKSAKRPALAELFREEKYFDGVARIRIDRLIPRDGSDDEK